MDWEILIKEAEKAYDTNGKDGFATVMLTEKGNLYASFYDLELSTETTCKEYATLNDMVTKGDTRILKMTTVYKEAGHKGLIVPSAWVRKIIYCMNKENVNTEVILGKKYERHIRTLDSISFFKKECPTN